MEATHPAVRVGAAAGGRLMHSRFYRLRGLRRSPAALAAGADEDDPRLGALQFRLRELTAHDPGAAAPALPARAIVDPQITVASQHPARSVSPPAGGWDAAVVVDPPVTVASQQPAGGGTRRAAPVEAP